MSGNIEKSIRKLNYVVLKQQRDAIERSPVPQPNLEDILNRYIAAFSARLEGIESDEEKRYLASKPYKEVIGL